MTTEQVMQWWITTLETAVPGISVERGVRPHDWLTESDHPKAFVYDPQTERNELDYQQESTLLTIATEVWEVGKTQAEMIQMATDITDEARKRVGVPELQIVLPGDLMLEMPTTDSKVIAFSMQTARIV